MGLALVHGIVTDHGGAVLVDSVVGQGTTFTIYLPRSPEPAQNEASQEASASPGSQPGTECVLFVDDETILVSLGQAILQRLGYDVVACTSSVEALEVFRAAPQPLRSGDYGPDHAAHDRGSAGTRITASAARYSDHPVHWLQSCHACGESPGTRD